MPNSIEIFQNTLLKLVVRSGADSDRQNIVLDVGEIGYTTDTKRLYVGDGITYGGVLAGNVVIGESVNFGAISTTPPAVGDLVYVTGNTTLYRYISGIPTSPTSWSPVGRIYSPENSTIVFSQSGNQIKVGTLSANNFSNDAVGKDITIDGSGRIALSGSISIDRVKTLSTTFVELPSSLKIGLSTYNFPVSGLSATALVNDGYGNLSWQNVTQSVTQVTVVSGTAASVVSGSLVSGRGIDLTVNNAQTTQAFILTSGPITIGIDNSVLLPTHFVEFNQNGVITRNTGGITVEPVTYMDFLTTAGAPIDHTKFIGFIGGISPPRFLKEFASKPPGSSLQSYWNYLNVTNKMAAASGIWKITLPTNVASVSGSVVDVGLKNTGVWRTVGKDQLFFQPDLSARYWFASPNTIYMYTFSMCSLIADARSNPNRWLANFFCSGTPDASTRFSVMVYE